MAPTAHSLKRVARRSKALTVGAWIAKNELAAARDRLGRAATSGLGSTHQAFSLEQSLAYIDMVVEDYRRYAGLDAGALAGSRVLEVGPGDSLGVAIELLGLGAREVVSVDRFRTRRDEGQQRAIQGALLERARGERRERLAAVVDEAGDARPAAGPRLVEGLAIEDAPAALGRSGFDVVVSRAVLAHTWDLDAALGAIDALLAPGGLSAHKVDLSDHGVFSDAGHNPLTFLTVPDALYDRMRRNTGLTNRRLIDSYRDWHAEHGYDARMLVTRVAGRQGELDPHAEELSESELGRAAPLIAAVRPRLLPRYRELPDSDLAAAGVFIAARASSP